MNFEITLCDASTLLESARKTFTMLNRAYLTDEQEEFRDNLADAMYDLMKGYEGESIRAVLAVAKGALDTAKYQLVPDAESKYSKQLFTDNGIEWVRDEQIITHSIDDPLPRCMGYTGAKTVWYDAFENMVTIEI